MLPSYRDLFACIYVPDFIVQAITRSRSDILYEKDPLAILDGTGSLQRVVALNMPARHAGAENGMTKLRAEALPNVKLLKRIIQQEHAAHSALMDCGYSFSPFLESTCPGTIIIDMTGTHRLLGSAMEIGQKLAIRASECGFHAHVALAENPDAALHVARGVSGVTVIPAGEETLRMASMPIEVLQLKPEIAATMDDWGIHDFLSLSTLPAQPLIRRVGEYGLQLQRLARGKTERKLVLSEPTTEFHESLEVEEPLELLESLVFVLSKLLQQLMARLKMRSLATNQAQLTLQLEVNSERQLRSNRPLSGQKATYRRALKLPVPTQDAGLLLNLIELDLAEHPPNAPVKNVMLEVFPAPIRIVQSGLFEPCAPDPAKLEVTIARLRALVGEEDESGRSLVGFPTVKDSHKPDSFEVLPFQSNVQRKQPHRVNVPIIGFRIFRPSLPTKVELKRNAPATVRVQGRRNVVLNASGPWRKNGSWWDQNKEWSRDEWDLELAGAGGNGLYRIFQDRRSNQWFIDGIYD